MRDVSTLLTQAAINGENFPLGSVPNTKANRELFDRISADVSSMQDEGITPQIPWEYTDDDFDPEDFTTVSQQVEGGDLDDEDAATS